jgi:hypothetical protein
VLREGESCERARVRESAPARRDVKFKLPKLLIVFAILFIRNWPEMQGALVAEPSL